MPTLDDELTGTVRVAPSAAFELMWALHFIAANHQHDEAFEPMETLRRRFGPELKELRSDGLAQYSTELIVLAHRSGTLLDLDLDRFFDRVEGAATEASGVPSLLSESPTERRIVAERLERLRTDKALRVRYVQLLSTIWEELQPDWMAQGRAAVVADAERWRRALADQRGGYMSVLGMTRLWPGRPDLDDVADAAAAQGRLVLNPSWFGGKIHIVELDGTVHVGRRTRMADFDCRQVANDVSANIKALADPTRLTILLRLARDSASVTELARELRLSQPTVSAHVQVLREAGLLEERANGRSAELSANEQALKELFSRTEEQLIRMFRP
ncbi:MAG TPA: metalloregulator ArsR/SmtB family transcription factor [bacterium]|nr:metalloregulator ArsR/SmtB family transcription factor [bacterium]